MNSDKLRSAKVGRYLSCCAAGVLLLATTSTSTLAQAASTSADAAADAAVTRAAEAEAKLKSEWSVRVDAVSIAVPQATALSLLPALEHPERVETAYGQLLKLIEQKQANLLGYAIVNMTDGNRAVSESIVEKRYPTEFDALAKPDESKTKPAEAPLVADGLPYPTTFETRNTGLTLEAEANVGKNADWIYVNFVLQNVRLKAFDSYEALSKNGRVVKLEQPQFSCTKNTMDVKLRNGQRCLVGVHKLPESDEQLELMFLHVVAAPTK